MKNRIILCSVSIAALLLGPLAQARYLNPETGRFQTMDSYEGDSQDPQSLHKYLYGNANPVNKMDPSGNDTINIVLQTLDFGSTLLHTPSSGLVTSIAGIGGPDVTKTLNRTLLEVELAFVRWTRREKINAAYELRNWIDALVSNSGAASAWDIVELHEGAMSGTANEFKTYADGARYALGTGLWQHTVTFEGKCYYAHAVNYALFGKMNRLCHDFFFSEEGQGIDTMGLGARYDLKVAINNVDAWKHVQWNDFGVGERQAKEFTAYGYNGALPSYSLPCKPSKATVSAKSFQWIWEPMKHGVSSHR